MIDYNNASQRVALSQIDHFDADMGGTNIYSPMNESFRVEIELENEDEQEKLYNELTNKGYVCRLLTL